MLTQHFIGAPGKEICVVVHWHNRQSPAVVICPGLRVGQSGTHFMFSYAARQCHRLGMNVFQFDYLGDGDSAGGFEDVTLDSLMASAQTVIEFAESLGCMITGLVGWGVGNVVVSDVSRRLKLAALVLYWPDFELIANFPAAFSPERLMAGAGDYLDVNLESLDVSSPEFKYWDALLGRAGAPHWNYGPLSLSLLHQLATLTPGRQLAEVSTPVLAVLDDDQAITDNAFSAAGWTETLPVPKNLKLEDRGYGSKGLLVWEEVAERIADWLAVKLGSDKDANRVLTPERGMTAVGQKCDYIRGERPRMYSLSFESAGQQVLGILHVPAATFQGPRPCLIYEPGLGGSRGLVAWADLQLIRSLVDSGIYVLLYDSRGSGVSDGEFFEITWSRRLADLNLALGRLAEIDQVDRQRLAILGWSAGAKVACHAANRIDGICGCVLWTPVLTESAGEEGGEQRRLARFIKDRTGKLVTREMGDTVIGLEYFVDAKKYDFAAEFERCRKPMLIAFGKQDDDPINTFTREFVVGVSAGRPERQFMTASGGHLFLRDSLREEVIKAAVAWLVNLFDATGDRQELGI